MLHIVFADFKNLLEASLHLSRDALHVHVGLVLFFAGAALIRSERRFLIAFGLLLALCLVGELFDLTAALNSGHRLRWLNSAKDIFNTMLWPGVWVMAGPQVLRLVRANRIATVAPSERSSVPGAGTRVR